MRMAKTGMSSRVRSKRAKKTKYSLTRPNSKEYNNHKSVDPAYVKE